MEIREGPGDRKHATDTAADYRVLLADLEPAPGITDCLDDVIFGLCDTGFVDTFSGVSPAGDSNGHLARFCNHLRHTTNADTVYLCNRQSLQIKTTTSVEFAEDTEEMHLALTTAINNLDHCSEAFQLTDVRVFPDYAKLSFTVIPLTPAQATDSGNPDYLAIVVDADSAYREVNSCVVTAVQAMFDLFTAEPASPDNRQLQRVVFDQLKHQHHICSDRITSRRREIFHYDLQHVTVHFEKLVALDSIGDAAADSARSAGNRQQPESESKVWGWQAVASQLEDDRYPYALYQQAELWGEPFTTELDTHILQVAALRYKDVCEAANLISFDNIQPLCVNVHAGSLLQDVYTDTLQQLTEMAVLRGEQLLLQLSEQTSVGAATETDEALRVYNQQLQSYRNRFGIKIGLSEFGTGHSSLLRMNILNPDVIRPAASLLPERDLPIQKWVDAAMCLPYVANSNAAESTSPASKPLRILVDGSQMPGGGEQLYDVVDTPETTFDISSNRKSLAA